MKKWILPLLMLMIPTVARAQTTTVFATVVDPNGNPYAGGTVSAILAMPVGVQEASVGGSPIFQHSGPWGLDSTGHFSIILPDNTFIDPAGTQWYFKVCGTPTNIGPRGNVAPVQVCFNSASPYLISGASVSLTAQLNAVAAILGPAQGSGGGGGTCSLGLAGPGGIFGVTGSPAACNGVLGLITSGNPGAIPYFLDANTLATTLTLTANALIKGGGSGVAPSSSSVTDDGTNPTRTPNGLNVGTGAVYIEAQNAGTGTGANLLACSTTGGVQTCGASVTDGVIGIAQPATAGASGTVLLAFTGLVNLVCDNTCTKGDVAVPSTTPGQIHDTGGVVPVNGYNFKVFASNTGAGTTAVVFPPGDIANAGGTLSSCLTTVGDTWSATTAGACLRVGAPTSPDGLVQFYGSASASGLPTVPQYFEAGLPFRTVTASPDPAVYLDRGRGIHYNVASGAPMAATIPASGSTNFAQNYVTYLYQLGLGIATVTPTTSTINGHASIPLYYGDWAVANGDNTNYSARIYRAGRTCNIVVGTDDGPVLGNSNLGPQGGQCLIPFPATVYEVDVKADGGTPNVIPRVEHIGGSTSDLLSGALATAASGGFACSRANAVLSANGTTTCAATLQNTALIAGDYIGLTSGTAGGTAKRVSITIWFGAAP